MRHQNRQYLEKFLAEHGQPEHVLEVGALNVNGAVKDLFTGHYVGTDMRAGENVDMVVNGHNLLDRIDPETFDMVVCFDTLEHDDRFWLTVANMRGVLKPGGWLMIAVPSRYCPEHDHPGDYWRFMPQSFKEFFFQDYENQFIWVDHAQDNPAYEDEVFGYAQKPL